MVSALGVGGWAVGGPLWSGDEPLGWGQVDDSETVRVIRSAIDRGIMLFDTADAYGAGHGERVLGQALGERRDQVVIATKWGHTFDEASRQLRGPDGSPEYLRRAVDQSLKRLATDRIDLYQLHINDLPAGEAAGLIATLEDLVEAGKIRWYGWSTDLLDRAESWAREGPHCTAIQHSFSVLTDAAPMVALCEKYDLASVNRGPLCMGLLTGKFTAQTRFAHDDIRGMAPEWLPYFRDGRPAPDWLSRVAALREALTVGGRTPAQGALAWIWARSGNTIPIPGCRTVRQLEENADALSHGPLSAAESADVDRLLAELAGPPAAT